MSKSEYALHVLTRGKSASNIVGPCACRHQEQLQPQAYAFALAGLPPPSTTDIRFVLFWRFLRVVGREVSG